MGGEGTAVEEGGSKDDRGKKSGEVPKRLHYVEEELV